MLICGVPPCLGLHFRKAAFTHILFMHTHYPFELIPVTNWCAVCKHSGCTPQTDIPFQPAPHLSEAWLRVRIAVLHAVWTVRTRSPQHSAFESIAQAAHLIRENIRFDWRRVKQGRGDVRPAGTDQGCSHWLRGAAPAMTEEHFKQRWCCRGVMCRVLDGRLSVRLKAAAAL